MLYQKIISRFGNRVIRTSNGRLHHLNLADIHRISITGIIIINMNFPLRFKQAANLRSVKMPVENTNVFNIFMIDYL